MVKHPPGTSSVSRRVLWTVPALAAAAALTLSACGSSTDAASPASTASRTVSTLVAVASASSPTGNVRPIAAALTGKLAIPTIGIGASAACDGQVLVIDDMLGMFERVPRFVKRYENIAETISAAVARYAEEVRSRTFPGEEQLYRAKEGGG